MEEKLIKLYDKQVEKKCVNLKYARFMINVKDHYLRFGKMSKKQIEVFQNCLENCMEEVDEDCANKLEYCMKMCSSPDKLLTVVYNTYKKHGKISLSDKDHIDELYKIYRDA